MPVQTLPVSNYVRTTVNLTPAGAQAQDLNTLLILDDTPVIDIFERIRTYSTLSELAADFGTSGAIYSCAALYFAQVPRPSQVKVGRWVKAAAGGGLRGAPLTAAEQELSNWTSITTGSFQVVIDGGAATNITGLNFSGATNLPAVAAIIQAAMTGVTVTWNAVYARFEFTRTVTGTSSLISFLGTAPSGSDISDNLKARSTDSGAYIFQGSAAETAATAVSQFDLNYGMTWYALMMPAASVSEHLSVSEFIEGADNRHIYGVSTQDTGCLVAVNTTNIGYQLKQLGRKKTVVCYSSSTAHSVASLLGRAITTDFNSNNTVIDVMYKNAPGVIAENLNTQQANALKSFNVNAFVAVSNSTNIIQWGDMSSGDPIDVITGTDWLAIAMQNACYNLLYTSPTKIPQTDAGANMLVNQCEAVCVQGVENGLLAPGVWRSAGFGLLKQNDYLAKGFYVYISPIDTQPLEDRDARKAPPIRVATKLAGAFRTIDIDILVNR